MPDFKYMMLLLSELGWHRRGAGAKESVEHDMATIVMLIDGFLADQINAHRDRFEGRKCVKIARRQGIVPTAKMNLSCEFLR